MPGEAMEAVRRLLERRFGLLATAFTDAELAHRLAPCAAAAGGLEALAARAAAQPLDGADLQALVSAMTIRESSFLRQASWFERLAREVLEPLILARRAAGRPYLRLWSAACASGEEAYTLALLLRELLPDLAAWQLSIVGTDICAEALAQARAGRYRAWSLRELSPERRAAHFEPAAEGEAQVREPLRRMVDFRLFNLLDLAQPEEAEPAAMDLVICRNVLMHLQPDARAQVAQRLPGRLSAEGTLVTAPSEASAELFRPLVRDDLGELLVFRRPAAAPPPRPVRPRPLPPRAAPAPRPSIPPPAAPEVVPAEALGLEATVDRLVAAGELASAREHCRKAAGARPLDPLPLRLLATVQEAEGEPALAVETLRRLLYLDDGDCDARFRLAAALRRLGRPAAARKELQALLALAARLPADDAADPPALRQVRQRILPAARQMMEGLRRGG